MLLVRQLETAVLGRFPSTNISYPGSEGANHQFFIVFTP